MEEESAMRSTRTYRMGELFAGPGGIAVGAHKALKDPALFRRVAIKHAWANDYDADTVRTYFGAVREYDPSLRRNDVIHADVRKLDIDALSDIDGFAFGFPCNDYSLVGERKGIAGDFGPLYSYGVKVLEAKQPEWFVAENVGGIRSHEETFRQILLELEAAGPGYELTTHLYRFEEYGVPQKRHRVIIVGIRKDLGKRFRVPAPTTPERDDQVTAAEALDGIHPSAPNHEKTRHSPSVVRRLSQIQPGQNAWNADLSEDSRINVKGATLSQIYKRLKPNEPSYTITGSGGGGTSGYHWEEPRALTNRERARLQTFDDHHRFEGGTLSVKKQVGMAVPPKGAQVIFEALFKTLEGIPYDSVPAALSRGGARTRGRNRDS
ncbi:hypothetical protein L332_08035 [Agrococcus pavilionensis RW1]|uniref:Cytosine-specific methyltransferase n=1 Tax=Agrococcus pavilionensis RW1 TaxID=1330458 RepID=U1LBB8_9MICO|nr:DNA (cytosine-5-)-methyltransferase [Agrococcus pavilionensis]ERG64398.1 hypothetical protein L332_08035 [Agrococcus pavilionensis RW1]